VGRTTKLIHLFLKTKLTEEQQMKSLKLFVSVATVCLLVGASSTAMAVGCPTGAIENQTVAEITVDGRSCFINEVIVQGNVLVTNSEDLIMIKNNVQGDIRVIGGRNATLVANITEVGNIVVSRNEDATLALNVAARTIRVNGNGGKAIVKRNAAPLIVCRNNDRLDAFENEAAELRCRSLGGGLGGPGGIFGPGGPF
jgi:uncharacterized protein YoxC